MVDSFTDDSKGENDLVKLAFGVGNRDHEDIPKAALQSYQIIKISGLATRKGDRRRLTYSHESPLADDSQNHLTRDLSRGGSECSPRLSSFKTVNEGQQGS